jgi:hypothetical protein
MAGKLSGSAIQTGTITSTQLSTELGPVSSELQLVGSGVSLNVSNTAVFTGNVGIGTTSPSALFPLDVQAPTSRIRLLSTTGTNSVLLQPNNDGGSLNIGIDNSTGSALFGAGAYTAGIVHTGNYAFIFGTNNAERARITSDGNLLVGLSSALTNGKIQIAGGIGLSGDTQIRQATNGDGNSLKVFATQFVASSINSGSYSYTGGGLIASVAAEANVLLLDVSGSKDVAGRHALQVKNDSGGITGTLFYGALNAAPTLFANSLTGNVGIGTSTPAGLLDVNGILYVSGQPAIQLLSSTADVNYKVIGGNGAGRGAVSYFDIREPAPRDFRNGTMAFGFTSYGLDNSGAWADAFAMCSYTDGTGGDPNIMVVGRNGSGVKVARQTYDSANFFKDGTVYTLDYTSASDVSVKEDVQNITNALSIITQLRPVTFKWTDDYILNGMSKNNNENLVDPDTGIIIIPEEKTINVGLIAQEVEAVLPTVVHQENVKLKDADRYLKNINYEKLVPHLIAAIQELKAEIDALKAQG